MYLISYDISKDKIRNKIVKHLLNYGRRVQYSVFECNISVTQCEKLYQELAPLVQEDGKGDIRIYQICKNCEQKIRVIGVNPKLDELTKEEADLFII